MKKIGGVLLVFVLFLIYTAFRLRNAPLPLFAGMLPLLALVTFLMYANPAKPNSYAIRALIYLGVYPAIQQAHATTKTWRVTVRTLIVLGMIFWFIWCMRWLGVPI